MAEESQTSNAPELNETRINFVRNLYNRISETLGNIELDSEQETNSIPNQSLEKSEGIGLFVYIRENLSEIKNKFPEFTENQTFNVLLEQWQKISEPEKLMYCSKIDEKMLEKSKKLKKVSKMAEKLVEGLTAPGELGEIEENIEEPENFEDKQGEEINADEFEEDRTPKKKNPNTEQNVSENHIELLNDKEVEVNKVSQENKSEEKDSEHKNEKKEPEDLTPMDVEEPLPLIQKKLTEAPSVSQDDLISSIEPKELEKNEKVQNIEEACLSKGNNNESSNIHNVDQSENPDNSIKSPEKVEHQIEEKNIPESIIGEAQLEKTNNEIIDKEVISQAEEKDNNEKSTSKILENIDDQTNEIVDENLVDEVKSSIEKEEAL